jgi:hypothetical protein
MSDLVATYVVAFSRPEDATALTAHEFETQLFVDLSQAHLLFGDYPDDEVRGVQPGDLQVLEIREIDPLHRHYDVRHQVSFEAPDLRRSEIERFGRYITEAFNIPQTEGRWRIVEATIASLERRRAPRR